MPAVALDFPRSYQSTAMLLIAGMFSSAQRTIRTRFRANEKTNAEFTTSTVQFTGMICVELERSLTLRVWD